MREMSRKFEDVEINVKDAEWEVTIAEVKKVGTSKGVILTNAINNLGYEVGDEIAVAILRKGYRIRKVLEIVKEEEE